MFLNPKPLKILITNNRLAKRTGTELYVVDLATRLLSAGHRPVVYSPQLGRTAQLLRSKTVPVIEHLDGLGFVPDVIHGHHTHPTMVAGLRFPRTPIVFACHSWASDDDAPPHLPSIRRYLAVDRACHDRLTGELGIEDEQIELLYNFVDLDRFKPRVKLPSRPKRALLFTNRANCGLYYHKLKIACHRNGIALDRIRSIGGPPCESPETLLRDYDLVFGRAKSAIEAMAVGTAVIICDRSGMGPLVTSHNVEQLRELNFGRRSFDRPTTVKNLIIEIGRYDADDAARVSNTIRQRSSLDQTVDRLLAIYEEIIDESNQRPISLESQLRAAAQHLENHRGAKPVSKFKAYFRRAA